MSQVLGHVYRAVSKVAVGVLAITCMAADSDMLRRNARCHSVKNWLNRNVADGCRRHLDRCVE